MLFALLAFLFYLAIGILGVFLFWACEIRFGDASDLDPDSFLVRMIKRTSPSKELTGAAHEKHPMEELQAIPMASKGKKRSVSLVEAGRRGLLVVVLRDFLEELPTTEMQVRRQLLRVLTDVPETGKRKEIYLQEEKSPIEESEDWFPSKPYTVN